MSPFTLHICTCVFERHWEDRFKLFALITASNFVSSLLTIALVADVVVKVVSLLSIDFSLVLSPAADVWAVCLVRKRVNVPVIPA